MTWLRPENITACSHSDPFELLEEFRSTYGRVGEIILGAYERIDPLRSVERWCEEDYYLSYAEEFIRLALATPPEFLAQQEVREGLVEITLRHHRYYERESARLIAWIISERVDSINEEMEG